MTAALVDTNVVVYAYDPAEPSKQAIAQKLLHALSSMENLVFSAQILNEFASVLLRRRGESGMMLAEIRSVVEELAGLGRVVPLTSEATFLALDVLQRHSLSFWDALIWSTAKEHGIQQIYSEDFQHGRDLEGVKFVNPFLEDLEKPPR